MGLTLLIDFGSTFTKVLAVDLHEGKLVGRAESPSTADKDMTIGLQQALTKLEVRGRKVTEFEIEKKLACSSAAGGLKLIAIGLVPELTLEAAKQAALGAGAKIIGTFSYELTKDDITAIELSRADLVLLVGGTDGGNKDNIIYNAQILASSSLEIPFIVAGNRTATYEVRDILGSAGKVVEVTENVLPDLDTINVEPVRSLIRQLFINRIVKAKGMDKAQQYVGDILMPTPMATLKAANLLTEGISTELGIGELMVVEIGGATTNIHTIAKGMNFNNSVIFKGLPEPYAKRTVEGDLGIRHNASAILDIAGIEPLRNSLPFSIDEKNLKEKIKSLSQNIEFLPTDEQDYWIDLELARIAVDKAVERHVGYLKEVFSSLGLVLVQYGKDCTGIKTIIGTGGIFAHSNMPEEIFKACLFNERSNVLKPKDPEFFIDQDYVLYGVGLLSEHYPAEALRIAKNSLRRYTWKNG